MSAGSPLVSNGRASQAVFLVLNAFSINVYRAAPIIPASSFRTMLTGISFISATIRPLSRND